MKNLGRVVRPHGLKGGAIFRGINDCSEEFLKSKLKRGSIVYLFLLAKGGTKKKVVLEKAIFGKKIILHFKGCSDRNALEKLLPFDLKIEEDEQGLVENLTGFTVCSQKNGETVGKVVSMGSNGVQKILEIRGKENFDIPWVPQFVEKVDKVEKKVFVRIPEYEQA